MGTKYYEYKELGLCVHCGQVNNNGKVTCNKCLKKQNEAYIKLKEYRLKNNLCSICGSRLTYRDKKTNGKMFARCYKCRDYNKKYKKLKKEGK